MIDFFPHAKSYHSLFCIHDSAVITAKIHYLKVIETDKVNLGEARTDHLKSHMSSKFCGESTANTLKQTVTIFIYIHKTPQ